MARSKRLSTPSKETLAANKAARTLTKSIDRALEATQGLPSEPTGRPQVKGKAIPEHSKNPKQSAKQPTSIPKVGRPKTAREAKKESAGAWIPVESSRVATFRYLEKRGELQVHWKNRPEMWSYYDVPLSVYKRFVNAASKGQFVNSVLNRYDYGETGDPRD